MSIDNIVQIECCSCGVEFGVSSQLDKNWHRTKAIFYCPNGHSQSYSKSTADKLAEQLEQKDREILRLKQEHAEEIKNLTKPKRKPKKK